MPSRFRFSLCAVTSFFVFVAAASASTITFTGQDNGTTANPPAHPNSTAAANNFYAAASALGTVSTITFESSPLGAFSSLSAAPGVTVSGSDYSGNNQTIRNSSNFPTYPSVDGSNTTAGGAQFVEMQGGTILFTFAQPTQFFGAFLTGVQTNFFQDTVTYSDGTSMSINVPGTGTSNNVGATDFVGFTDAGKSISSIQINAGPPGGGYDAIGVDDVSYQSGPLVASTPEPSSFVLLGTGVVGAIGCVRRRFLRG